MKDLLGNLARKLLATFGLKRRLTAAVSALIGVALVIPELQPYVPVLQSIAAWLGGAGLAHAAVGKNLLKPGIKAASFASVLQLLIAALPTAVPSLAHLVPLLQALASVLGTFGLGVASVKTKK